MVEHQVAAVLVVIKTFEESTAVLLQLLLLYRFYYLLLSLLALRLLGRGCMAAIEGGAQSRLGGEASDLAYQNS